jgi:hypothetical protein
LKYEMKKMLKLNNILTIKISKRSMSIKTILFKVWRSMSLN